MARSLAGCRAKLKRAKDHLGTLTCEIGNFLRKDLHAVETHFKAISGEQRWRYIGPDPDPDLALLVGEIAHHLRSALDHLLWQLLSDNDRLSPKAGNFEFPINWTAQSDADYDTFAARKIGSLAKQPIAALIREQQPYHRGNPGYQTHALWQVHELDRIDKHRLLHVIVTNAELTAWKHEITTGPQGLEITGLAVSFGRAVKQPGERQAEFTENGQPWQPDVGMDTQLSIRIALQELGLKREADVLDTMTTLCTDIEAVVNKFNGFFP